MDSTPILLFIGRAKREAKARSDTEGEVEKSLKFLFTYRGNKSKIDSKVDTEIDRDHKKLVTPNLYTLFWSFIMTKNVRILKHTSADFQVEVEGKTQATILAEIKAAGHTLGAKSLAVLMKGEKETAGDFTMTKGKPTPATTEAPSGKEAADAAKAAKANPDAAFLAKGEAMSLKKAGKTLTPEQAKLAAEVEKEIPTRESDKNTLRGKVDWSKILPQTPVPVLKDSMIHRLLVRLCDPKGASKEQLMKEFGWSAGGFGGVIHWEPKAKGYLLQTEKRDGVLYYHLAQIGTGLRVKAADVLIRDKGTPAPDNDLAAKIRAAKEAAGIAVPAPKAPKAPKAESAPAPAASDTNRVRVPKEALAAVPPMAGASVTKRTSTKKAGKTA